MLQHGIQVLRQNMRDRHESLRHEMAARCGGHPPSAPAYSPNAPAYSASLPAGVGEEPRAFEWLGPALFALAVAGSVVVYAILFTL